IDQGTQVLAGSVIDGAHISPRCRVGPLARLRPGTVLGPDVQIGNFVEVKNAALGARTKANHLAYIGDAELGSDCNVGAGSITCNYDGVEKHRTTMGNDVFIGSNATLVAPIDVGDRAFVAAGSTATKSVPAGSLAVGRGRQRNIEGWKRPQERGREEESG
ncbi:MAG: DapH/DapD/GlmU-related protein, partial [Pseudomonadales bacterium]